VLLIYYEHHTQSTVIKEKRRNTLVNAKRPLGTPEGHFVLYGVYAGGLSSNSGVLGNGSPIHCINVSPYYHSKACTTFIELLSSGVCNIVTL